MTHIFGSEFKVACLARDSVRFSQLLAKFSRFIYVFMNISIVCRCLVGLLSIVKTKD